jgi:UPF0755 protein
MRIKTSGIILIVMVGIVFLSIGLGGYMYIYQVRSQATERFGPASSKLSRWQRILLSYKLLQKSDDLIFPAGGDTLTTPFQIVMGESVTSVVGRLAQEGLIKDKEALILYLQYKGYDTSIKAGDYRLSPGFSPIQIISELKKSSPSEITFTILEGWRLEEIAEALPVSGLNIKPDEFLQIAHIKPEGYSFCDQLPQSGNDKVAYPIEGFMLPGVYSLQREINVVTFITTILKHFDETVTADIREGISQQGLTLYQGIVLASIVEREAMLKNEKPQIASVYINRIAKNMPLQADPTVQYAIGFDNARGGWWPVPLDEKDLLNPSPYNTYMMLGLPPAPISNPNLDSIKAVAFPAQTDYYYFRATCDGSNRHLFAKTAEEHFQNACP